MLTNWGKGHEADKFCESFSVDREKMVPQKYITPLKRETGEGREFGRKKSFLSNPQFDPRNLEPKIGLKKKRRMNSQGKHSMGRIDANLGDFSSALKWAKRSYKFKALWDCKGKWMTGWDNHCPQLCPKRLFPEWIDSSSSCVQMQKLRRVPDSRAFLTLWKNEKKRIRFSFRCEVTLPSLSTEYE